MAEWQPIETAPRDGGHIRARTRAEVAVVCWSASSWSWMRVGTTDEMLPTHWQPLPAPPTAQGEGGGRC